MSIKTNLDITEQHVAKLNADIAEALRKTEEILKSGDEEKIMGRMIMLGQKSQKDQDTIAMLELTILTRLIDIAQ